MTATEGWWDSWDGLYRAELAAFERHGAAVLVKHKSNGFLLLEAIWPAKERGDIRLLVGFSSLHPYCRPEVTAPDLELDRHQNPHSKALCLLIQGNGQWDPPSTRFAQGLLDGHVLHHLGALLEDEHGLRRLANLDEANLLRAMLAEARMLWARLKQSGDTQATIRSLVALIKVGSGSLELTLKPGAFGLVEQPCWRWSIPLPARKPFREAKLRIDSGEPRKPVNGDLQALLVEARTALELVQSTPELSLNQIGKREARCRTHLARLLRIAWLSPRIVEAIVEGEQPRKLTRQMLLAANLPIDWAAQERLLGFAG